MLPYKNINVDDIFKRFAQKCQKNIQKYVHIQKSIIRLAFNNSTYLKAGGGNKAEFSIVSDVVILFFSFDVESGISPGRSPLDGYPGLVLQVWAKLVQNVCKLRAKFVQNSSKISAKFDKFRVS